MWTATGTALALFVHGLILRGILAMVERIFLSSEGLTLTGGKESIATGMPRVVGLQRLIGQFLGVLQHLERKGVVLRIVEGGRPGPHLGMAVGIGGRKIILGGYFLQVAKELVQFNVVLLVLRLLLHCQAGLRGSGLGEIDGGLLAEGLERALERLDAIVLTIYPLAVSERGVVLLGEPLVGGEGVPVGVHLETLLVLILNAPHL